MEVLVAEYSTKGAAQRGGIFNNRSRSAHEVS
jgi:hypothetical protein